MLQRIQTVYLAIAAISAILLFFFPLAYFYNEIVGNYRFFIYGVQSMDPDPKVAFGKFFTIPLLVIVLVSFIFTVSAIFQFKNRPLQNRLCTFNVLTNLVFIMVVFFFYINKIKSMTLTEPDYSYIGMILPLISLAMLTLASRAIKKDEALVKSADRLR
jgi:hypothetical protein